MNREIKFRGKDQHTGQWVYGYYARNVFGDHLIVAQDYYHDGSVKSTDSFIVIPETVGQFTGLKDKNKQELFEGDLISEKDGNDERTWLIRYNQEDACFVFQNPDDRSNYNTLTWLFSGSYLGIIDTGVLDVEIIGSIHAGVTDNIEK